MVHTVVIDKTVESVLKDILSSKQIQVGLLVGQSTKVKDYVLLAVRTPLLQELKDDGDSREKRSTGMIEDWWVIEHAKQVVSLLPGGVDVVGLFCVSPKEMLPSLQPRLGGMISNLASQSGGGRPHSKYTLLHYCTASLKNKGQVIDVGDRLGGFRPAEIKFQSNPVQLIKIESTLRLSCDWYEYFHGNTTQDILKSVQASLKDSLIDIFSRSLFKVNGRLIQDEGEPLVVKTKKAEQQALENGVELDLLTRQPVLSSDEAHSLSRPRRVQLTGSLPLIAYLHQKATCREAFEAVKEDAVRSLSSQLVALTEADSLQELNNSSTPLPYRMSVTIPDIPWVLSEYSLPGEDNKECESRVCDLFGVSSAQATCTSPWQQTPPAVSIESFSEPTADDSMSTELHKKGVSTHLWTLMAALIVLVAIVTGAVLYL